MNQSKMEKIKMENEDIKRIRELMEFLVKKEVKSMLLALTSQEKEIYELTGSLGQTQIKDKLKVAPNTVTNTWKKLEDMGLLEKTGKTSGYKKVI